MDYARSNCNGKIWLFWNIDIDCKVIEEDEQQITCEIVHNELHTNFTNTFVYAKCKDHLRRPLWERLLHQATVEMCFHDIKIHKVHWQRPPEQWVKLNTDGSALSNPGRIGAGGIIRDHRGEMILAFATPLGEGTNNQAEVRAAIFGMTWLLQIGYRNVILEVDSQLLSIHAHVQQVMDLIRQASRFQCKHIYREANTVADLLSKESHKMTSSSIYNSSQQLPKEARGYYQLDIMEMASFRRRKIKRIKEPP
ncbi:hypothetical protein R3W88_022601 [Solanum pinnatisectum]|uniref:RNase H type-1 domain-containing protein n=1 Tax=Solanum pinnatisectum TaxID=50273 RepID=A0AAV9LW20_9SOLN|nr:hypothetical protein R3W88_022601 [Solanum pinnatisectum]